MTKEQNLIARAIAGALKDAETPEATKALTDVACRVANAMLNADHGFKGVDFLNEALRA
jgi:hypothetical protein